MHIARAELQSRYEKDERGAYYEWRWEVHRILFGQSVLLREGGIRLHRACAVDRYWSEKIVRSHAILATNSEKKNVTVFVFGF